MSELPEVIQRGEPARLIPVVADTSKENRAASVLLAGMTAVDQLSQVLLGGVGQRVGKRAKVSCFTEVVPKMGLEGSKLRPDGLIVVEIGKRSWTALVEAKIGRAELDPDQVEAYLKLARINGIDALITVSNQFVALPTHHPVALSKSARRGVELYHWSWMHILTQATLACMEDKFDFPTQGFVLNEVVRYFKHYSVGVSGFDRMNSDWKELVLKVKSGGTLTKTNPEVINSVAAWHQESRDLALIMSRLVGCNVLLHLPGKHKTDPVLRLKDDSEHLVATTTLCSIFNIPDTAAPLKVSIDLRRQVVTCGMRISAPKDKKTARARINWLLRQLGGAGTCDIFVTTILPGRAVPTHCSLEEVKANPQLLEGDSADIKPNAFEIQLVRDLSRKMSGRRTFIESVETAIPEFYQQVGQHLQSWVAPPPTIVEVIEPTIAEVVEPEIAEVVEPEIAEPTEPEIAEPTEPEIVGQLPPIKTSL